MKLILASGSPRRKELLEQIGLTFTVMTSNADENASEREPGELVKALSRLKAEAVFREYKLNMAKLDISKLNAHREDMEQTNDFAVIGADTIVYANGEVYGKPSDEKKAYEMLKSLSGGTHQVYTGVTIMCSDGRINEFYERTDVEICTMSDEEIYGYIQSGDPFDKAGGYGIQGIFAAFVKGIHGDYNNVVGLPVSRVYQELKNMEGIL